MWSEFDILELPPPPHRIRILKIFRKFCLACQDYFWEKSAPNFQKRCYVPVRYISQSINYRLGRWILPQVHTFTLLQDDKRRKK